MHPRPWCESYLCRNEVGHVDSRLGKALEALAVQLIEQDGKQHRNRKAEKQAVQIEQNGILEHTPAVIRIEECTKMLQAHPLTAGNAEGGLVIAEGNLHTVHREIAEYNEEQKRRNQ